MALVEAMASRLPIVATDVSGNRQVMVPGETGFLVPPNDPQELAKGITALLGDPDRAYAMGIAARRRVETLFSARKQAREHIALFEQDRVSTALSQVSS
jgi:glycosyltransferase involved in cell wall biosynthesis